MDSQSQWVLGDQTPLTSTPALVALWERWGDPVAVLNVLHNVRTWGELAAMPATARVQFVGPVLASVGVPAVCPPLCELPGGARAITPYEPAYPSSLTSTQWPVLYATAPLPAGPAVMIAGPESPSPQGVEIARSSALAAAIERVVVVATLTPGVGALALRTAIDAGASAIAVVPHGLDLTSTQQGLLDQLRRHGGAAVTAARPGTPSSQQAVAQASRLAAALTRAAVIAEVGAAPGTATTATRAAIAASLFLIVPTAPSHHVPMGSLGLPALTQSREFTPDWYGTSPRIDERIVAGLPAADAVVANQAQIAAALRTACRPEPALDAPAQE